VVATVGRAAYLLQEVGCEVAPGDSRGFEQRDCNALTAQVFRVEGGRYFESVVAGRQADLHSVMRRYLESPAPSFDDYLAAEQELEGLRYDLATYFRDHDVLLCPVSPVPAFRHEPDRLSIGGVSLPARHVVRPTAPFNVTGSPALSVPFGWSHDGLPIGVQIVGRHLDEATVLRVGMVLERHAEVRRPTFV
jgi:aspartyl-tRNA(Asn)/glutamyl-tRNA(Gln) amidotransferase subunit A